MKETRKQKIERQAKSRDYWAGKAADRAFGPIHDAIERGDLVIGPARRTDDDELRSITSGLEFCPRCASGPRQEADIEQCPDCGYRWSGPLLRGVPHA